MSEYQYYEFQAVDTLLTQEQRNYVSSISRRVELTAQQAIFTYTYGNLPVKPEELMMCCFDAMFYIANWGTARLLFRLPRPLVNSKAIHQYAMATDAITITTTDHDILLDITINQCKNDNWIEEKGILTELLPLRDNILQGDYRVLYLAWLGTALDSETSIYDDNNLDDDDLDNDLDDESFDDEEYDEDNEATWIIEPMVPPGLQTLTPPLQAFIRTFSIDENMVSAAAEASPPQRTLTQMVPVAQLVARLSPAEQHQFLVQLAEGEQHVRVQLLNRLHQLVLPSQDEKDHTTHTPQHTTKSSTKRRSYEMLITRAKEKQQQRQTMDT